MIGAGPGPARYRVHGVEMESDRCLRTPLRPAPMGPDAPPPDLRLRCPEPPAGAAEPAPTGEPLWASTARIASGAPAATLRRVGEEYRVRYTEVVEFALSGDGDRIVCRVMDPGYPDAVEIYLLGVVLACWLERSGRLALHGSAVEVDGRGVAFLGEKGTGKSSLAAAFLAGGAALLTDDLLAVDPQTARAHPAYPRLRMWPDQARRFVGDPSDLSPVEPGGRKRRVTVPDDWDVPFADGPVPLRRIYLPERRPADGDGGVRITPVRPTGAVMGLVRDSFLVAILHAMGLQGPRLERIGRLVSRVPVRRLSYPSGWDRLASVREAVREDLAESGRVRGGARAGGGR